MVGFVPNHLKRKERLEIMCYLGCGECGGNQSWRFGHRTRGGNPRFWGTAPLRWLDKLGGGSGDWRI